MRNGEFSKEKNWAAGFLVGKRKGLDCVERESGILNVQSFFPPIMRNWNENKRPMS